MKAALLLLAICLATLASAPSVVEAQRSKGSAILTGVVIGPNDRPVPHASITYQTSDGSAPHATHADAHGHFVISHLPANDYDIRASAKGIFSDWQKNISLRRGQTKSFELRLIYAKEMPKSQSWQKPKS
jgi:Carboxypeptidase regulatory-like domain